jgi:hypothetical protein
MQRRLPALTLSFALTGLLSYACGSSDGPPSQFQPPPPPADGGNGDAPIFGDALGPDAPVVHNDFKNPILDTGVPPNAATLFGGQNQMGTGPCLYEPELGTLFPNNWLRPRFRWNVTNQENLFEIKLVIPNEVSPLLIYTTQSG